MFQAAVFDLDGLIIDSEPFWRSSQSEVFTSLGIPLSIDDCAQTMGLRIDEVIRYWQLRFSHIHLDIQETETMIVQGVKRRIETHGQAKVGVLHAISTCLSLGMRLGLASSSYEILIETVLKRFNLEKHFQALCSAEREIHGKPAPDVYLTVMRRLGVGPGESVAFEDSPTGVRSAKAAGVSCICIPDPLADRTKIENADIILASLEDVSAAILSDLYRKRNGVR